MTNSLYIVAVHSVIFAIAPKLIYAQIEELHDNYQHFNPTHYNSQPTSYNNASTNIVVLEDKSEQQINNHVHTDLHEPIKLAETVAEDNNQQYSKATNSNNESLEDADILLETIEVIGEKNNFKTEPASTLKGDELTQELAPTLGETLQNQAGVHNSTFGPGVGIPVIRGMTGSRIKVLQSSMGTFDASSVSPDHAITIEPLLVKEIKVLRGPATFRYNGTAMGGAVDVKTGRIPEWIPDNNIDATFESRYDWNSDLTANVFKLDAGTGPLVVHIDGYDRSSNNIHIPDNALAEEAVLEQFGNLIEFDNTDGFVANSDSESHGYSFGSSLVFDQGYIGFAVNELENNYGIPPGGLPPHSDDPANVPVTPENLRIDMDQTRWDFATEIYDLPYGINSVSLKFGDVDYTHSELARGLPSTTYDSDAQEFRFDIDVTHNEFFQGSFGYQWSDQEFGAVGIESFIPPSDIERYSFYIIESIWIQDFLNFEFGYREESSKIKPKDDFRNVSGTLVELPDFDHTAHSLSGAFELIITDNISIRLALTQAQRTPAIQEVLSLGPHFATRSYEIGNIELEDEEISNVDLGVGFSNEHLDFNVNIFQSDIDNFIYQENIGFFYDIETRGFQLACVQVTDCVPVFAYFQQDAEFSGYEAELKFRPVTLDNFSAEVGFFADYVRGKFVNATNDAEDVPRLPPRRAGVFFESSWDAFDFNWRFTHASDQKRAGLNETPTEGYNRIDAGLTYNWPFMFESDAKLFLNAKNITDEEIRHSTSFLRNFTPEPGRSIELGLRLSF